MYQSSHILIMHTPGLFLVNQPMVNGTGDNSGVKTPKSPGYDNKRSSVDNLLDQLENSVPSPAK